MKDVTIHINEGYLRTLGILAGSQRLYGSSISQALSAGTITVDGDSHLSRSGDLLNAAFLRQKNADIGMIFQHFNLMAQMTAMKNVAFCPQTFNLFKEQKAEKWLSCWN